MSETRYTEQHEWVRVEGDEGTIGITRYATEQLGDVVFVELPAVGKAIAKGGDLAAALRRGADDGTWQDMPGWRRGEGFEPPIRLPV